MFPCFSWTQQPPSARSARLSVCWSASRGQVRGCGREACPQHHLVARRGTNHQRSLQASGQSDSRNISSLFNLQSGVVRGIHQGFNHTKCYDFSRMESLTKSCNWLLNPDQNMHSASFSGLTFENVQFIPFCRRVLMET